MQQATDEGPSKTRYSRSPSLLTSQGDATGVNRYAAAREQKAETGAGCELSSAPSVRSG